MTQKSKKESRYEKKTGASDTDLLSDNVSKRYL